MKKVKYIIVHSMAKNLDIDGSLMKAKDFLESLGLSAHFLIDSKGEVERMKHWQEIAYHAGQSRYNEDVNLNTCSIGIELLIDGVTNYGDWKEAIGKQESFTLEHYKSCAEIAASICFENGLHPQDAILSHQEVSGDHVRGKGKGKVDVGEGFDMTRLISLTEQELLNYPSF